MPGRQSHGGAPSKKPKPKARKTKKRALDAFSIASHENPDKVKIRQHRLGAKEGGNRPGKRLRDGDEDEEEETVESKPKKQKKGPEKGRFDELDVDEGSDSEGNEWKLGQVDSDDDSDLDSDEAFGESDEERFNGFAFSGSSDKKVKKKTSRRNDMNLDEDDVEDSDSELDEGDLGEDAVDLATILDMVEAEEAEERVAEQKRQSRDQGGSEPEMEEDIVPSTRNDLQDEEDSDSIEEAYESEEGDESEGSDDESSESDPDDDEDLQDPAKIAAVTNLVNNLREPEIKSRQRSDTASEYKNPDTSSKGSLSLEKLLGTSTLEDPQTKMLKVGTAKKNSKPQEVPLAQRQKDRLDRAAAYDESKKTLDRWTDTVKHNRRADHLMFPLQDNETASAHANKQLLPTNLSKPFNELEATIQAILEESGLATANGKDDEDQIREFEELQANKLSVNEVKARRARLAMARELLFREEKKAKRIKKIKSKSYRKVHRKQREKEERLNKEALAEGGFAPSEDELEAQDRRRAEERMGAKHRGSKWAKAMKETGRAAWDEDARSGVTEMARRDEELRKRVEGRAVRKEFENGSDESMSDSEDERSEYDEPAEQERLLRELKQFDGSALVDESLPGARLANMDFMRKADAARRKANDEMVEDMRRELAGEESESEEEAGDIGRRLFGPGNSAAPTKSKTNASEFEEPAGSDEDVDPAEDEFRGFDDDSKAVAAPPQAKSKRSSKATEQFTFKHPAPPSTEGGAWSKVSKSTTISEAEAKRRRHKKNNVVEVEELDLAKASMIATQSKPRKSAKKSSTLEMNSDSDESGDENTVNLPFAIKDQELIKRAFAGADVVGDFEAEKKQTIEDEDEKFIDNRLPGWGSWVGEGITKKEKARNKERFLTKQEGIKEKDRKDAKLARVIINEKRVKKNGKYLASSLPHPFETRQQYERSLRLPIGPEWTTKETFQDATKPRILLKQGIIAPMSKPLL